MKILLVEPSYRNKYPPLGLMKISTYHKMIGDDVTFIKGENKELRAKRWDRIYITSMFTFSWNTVIRTIKYYKKSVDDIADIYSGGILATIQEKELYSKYPISILPGLLDKPGVLGNNDIIVDSLVPDFSIVDKEKNEYLKYNYKKNDSYIAYATRGCIRNCSFCSVPTMEPEYIDYIDIKDQIKHIKENYGERKNLILLDNNVLASDKFDLIIQDIKDLGYEKGATYKRRTKTGRLSTSKKYVDFNQGIDARLLTEKKCKKLSEIAIRPMRLAFDHANKKYVKLYKEKVRLASKYDINHLSNYVLFNYKDKPEDLYRRLEINIKLNNEFETEGKKTRIWSFPMKYCPVKGEFSRNRKYIGEFWNARYLRGVQCILNATRGVVGPKEDYFRMSFGKDIDDFRKIISMPDNYIIYRNEHIENGLSARWEKLFCELEESDEEYKIIMGNDFKNIPDKYKNGILKHYI